MIMMPRGANFSKQIITFHKDIAPWNSTRYNYNVKVKYEQNMTDCMLRQFKEN
jgi:hypothetical protein